VEELDVTELLAFMRGLSSTPEFKGVPVTFNSVMLKLIERGLAKSPEMNAHFSYNKHTSVGKMVLCEDVNIAAPMRSRDGRMITPVLKRINQKTLRQVCVEMADLKRRVQNTDVDCLLLDAALQDTWSRLAKGQVLLILRRLFANFVGPSRLQTPTREQKLAHAKIPAKDRVTPEELVSGTTLVSNVGSSAPDLRFHVSILEIIAPHTSAIMLTPVRKQPLVVTKTDGTHEVAIREVMPMTVCFDHRAMDFEHITGFLREVARLCSAPKELLGEILRV
jgi:pyruvate dehydrogenase E2 component (dihydrolipoamide acetyltransferase)